MDTIIAALVGAVGGFLSGLLPQLFAVRKNRAESTDIITQAAQRAVEIAQSQLDEAASQRDDIEDRYALLLQDYNRVIAGSYRLYNQLTALDETPIYTPPDRRRQKRDSQGQSDTGN